MSYKYLPRKVSNFSIFQYLKNSYLELFVFAPVATGVIGTDNKYRLCWVRDCHHQFATFEIILVFPEIYKNRAL